jgi:hypothetical protein
MFSLGHRYTEVQRRNRTCFHFYVVDGDSVTNPCCTRKFSNNTNRRAHRTIAGRGEYGHILPQSGSWCKGQGQPGERMQQISRRQLEPPVVWCGCQLNVCSCERQGPTSTCQRKWGLRYRIEPVSDVACLRGRSIGTGEILTGALTTATTVLQKASKLTMRIGLKK